MVTLDMTKRMTPTNVCNGKGKEKKSVAVLRS